MESSGKLITVSKGWRLVQALQDGQQAGERKDACTAVKAELEAGVMRRVLQLIHDLGIKSKSMEMTNL